MGVIECASGSSCWRGLEYYKKKKIININKINVNEFYSEVIGNSNYNVYLNIKNPRKSTCNCPHANGKRIICKHIVATYFSVVPNSASIFEEEQERFEKEFENYQNKEYENFLKFINNMSKKELINEIVTIFDYAPEWVYDDFIRRNDIDGK